jgi:hypothetical protein
VSVTWGKLAVQTYGELRGRNIIIHAYELGTINFFLTLSLAIRITEIL